MLGDDIIDSPVPCMRQMVNVFESYGGPGDRGAEGAEGRDLGLRRDRRHPRGRQRPAVPHPRPGGEAEGRARPRATSPSSAATSSPPTSSRSSRTRRAAPAARSSSRTACGGSSRSRTLYGYHFEGVRHDAGNKLGFLKATVEFALKRDDLGGPFREYLKSPEALSGADAPGATSSSRCGRVRRRVAVAVEPLRSEAPCSPSPALESLGDRGLLVSDSCPRPCSPRTSSTRSSPSPSRSPPSFDSFSPPPDFLA